MLLTIQKFIHYIKLLVFVFFLVCTGLFLYPKYFNVPYTPMMALKCSKAKLDFKECPIQNRWIEIDKLPTFLPMAIVSSEDAEFFKHSGIYFPSIIEAFRRLDHGKIRMGGSTITQQVVKNLFLIPTKSFLRKGAEAFLAVAMELTYSKKRILEIYLNIIELGPHVYGVSSAAKFHFDINVSDVTLFESTRLAAMLPSPSYYFDGQVTDYLLSRESFILRNIGNFLKVNY